MGLGVLEQTALEHVPGTVLLNDAAAHSEAITGRLKHGTGRDKHIVLSPQPSEDPNDPLNWPRYKKEVYTAILCLGSMLCAGTNGPFLNASYFLMAQQINTDLTKVVVASGYNLLAAGCIGPFMCAFSRKYGKRPCLLFSTLICIIGTAIGEVKVGYNTLLAARIVQGFSTSAYESLVISAVGDMYFVHQRGVRISLINFILNAASNLASIICGQVFQDLGWLWLFHLFQIFLVIQFVLLFLFCPETVYIRDSRYDTDSAHEETLDTLGKIKQEHQETVHATSTRETDSPVVPKKKTFVQELAVYTGVYSTSSVFKFVFGPFLALLNPGACYAIIASGLLNSWYVGAAIIVAGIFSGPPWHFNAAQVGYICIGPFVGGTVGSIFTAVASDRIVKYMTKKNNGVYEPEFRLVLLFPAAICCSIGMFLFGYTMAIKASAIICSFLFGVMLCGILIGIFASLAYGLDSFRSQSSEIFVMNMVFKNFMFYALSNFANNWVMASGPEQIMFVFGGTSLFLCLLGVPLYVYGKRLRSWWSRHDLFVTFKMETAGPASEMA